MENGAPEKIYCLRCIYYYVTWDLRMPHGCRAMGMKTKEMPSVVVRKVSGKPCLHYTQKPPRS